MKLFVVLLLVSYAAAVDFSKYKNCKDCTDAGYGWCPILRKCGGFANKQCGEGERYVNYPPGEDPKSKAAAPQGPSDVVVLTQSNFKKLVLNTKKTALVEFYAPWCGHCKSLAPAWEQLGTAFAGEQKVVIGKVDATVESSLASTHGVKGYPTILLFTGGKTTGEKYTGGRDVQNLIDFVNSKAGTDRKLGGKKAEDLGLMPKMNKWVDRFAVASEDRVEELLEKASATAKKLNNAFASFYVSVLNKVRSEGPSFVQKTMQRYRALVNDVDVPDKKVEEFNGRLNILKYFQTALSESADFVKQAAGKAQGNSASKAPPAVDNEFAVWLLDNGLAATHIGAFAEQTGAASVGDLMELTSSDWEQIALPLLPKRRLQRALEKNDA